VSIRSLDRIRKVLYAGEYNGRSIRVLDMVSHLLLQGIGKAREMVPLVTCLNYFRYGPHQ